MPLPASTMTWPPAELTVIQSKIARWAAWYDGTPEALTKAYGVSTAAGPMSRVRPAQFSGGLVGSVARWFWGQPTQAGSQNSKLHIPIAAEIAAASSDLLFAEQPKIVTSEDEDQESERLTRLDTILQGTRWESMLPEAGELASAFGGVYLRVVWDDQVADHPLVTVVRPNAAWPEFRLGVLTAVTFWQIIHTSGSTVVRHLERHEKGRIEHGVYEGTTDKLGGRVPLTDYRATADITVDADSGIDTGTNLMTAVYVKNDGPDRGAENDPISMHLGGGSDFNGVEPLMDQLDQNYTYWMRDIRLAKPRIMVDQTMLETDGPGQGASFDMDREVFVKMNLMAGGGDVAPITAHQFTVNSQTYQAVTADLTQQIITGAGYSVQTFGIHGDGGAQTATEVAARERTSMTTREKKTRHWSPALAHILQTLLEVDAAKFGGPGPFERLVIEFPASVQPTIMELAQTAQTLAAAQAASIKTLVALTHPDWDKDAVDVEVGLIQAQNSLTVPDLGPLPGEGGSDVPAGDETDA